MKTYTKEELINSLREIRERGWISTNRRGNDGGVGNTLEDLLGIEENNLPIPNAAEWELKAQRKNTSSLLTIFHMEPSPRACRLVPQLLLPKYGWAHQNAGAKYPAGERSFRQTIKSTVVSDRGFTVKINKEEKKVLISFDATKVGGRHQDWLNEVESRIGLGELSPQPYWGFNDLFHKAGTKLHNCFFVQASVKRIAGVEHFQYEDIYMLKSFSLTRFVDAIEAGNVLVDFDARTGHNHGTKFRLKRDHFIDLYDEVTRL